MILQFGGICHDNCVAFDRNFCCNENFEDQDENALSVSRHFLGCLKLATGELAKNTCAVVTAVSLSACVARSVCIVVLKPFGRIPSWQHVKRAPRPDCCTKLSRANCPHKLTETAGPLARRKAASRGSNCTHAS